jgi:regulator of protease activity HflC (stomatin/prohibitin superfamily)
MGVILLTALLFAAVALFLVARSIVIVPKDQAFVMETLGRIDRVLTPGLHIVPPVICRVSARVPLAEQSLDVPTTPAALRTGSEASVHGIVSFRVLDAKQAVSQVGDYRAGLAGVASAHWRSAIQASDHLTFIDQVRGAETGIREAVANWGLEILEILPEVSLSDGAMRALQAESAESEDRRIAQWVTERRQRLGPDGRPTPAQRAAYREWLDLEVRMHADEIEEARRHERESN